MTFLEIQLERATQTCMQQKQAQESVFAMNQKVNMHEEKIVNISRLVKLLQSYSDAQEEDTSNLKNKVSKVEEKLDLISAELSGNPGAPFTYQNTLRQNQVAFTDLLNRSRSNEKDERLSPLRSASGIANSVAERREANDRLG